MYSIRSRHHINLTLRSPTKIQISSMSALHKPSWTTKWTQSTMDALTFPSSHPSREGKLKFEDEELTHMPIPKRDIIVFHLPKIKLCFCITMSVRTHYIYCRVLHFKGICSGIFLSFKHPKNSDMLCRPSLSFFILFLFYFLTCTVFLELWEVEEDD